jgi:hypothetical protein
MKRRWRVRRLRQMQSFIRIIGAVALIAAWVPRTATSGSADRPVDSVDQISHCSDRRDLVGACFTVRGRLSVYNGNPSVRIWPIGTTRLLGLDPVPLFQRMWRPDWTASLAMTSICLATSECAR